MGYRSLELVGLRRIGDGNETNETDFRFVAGVSHSYKILLLLVLCARQWVRTRKLAVKCLASFKHFGTQTIASWVWFR